MLVYQRVKQRMAVSPDYPVSIDLRTVDRNKSTSADQNNFIKRISYKIMEKMPYVFV